MYSLGQYIPRESPVHNRDPRVKIIGVLGLSIIIFKVSGAGLIGAAAIVALAAFLAGIPTARLLKTLRPVLPLFSILFLLYIFFTPGKPLPVFPIGPVQISYEGLNLGIIQAGRFILLVLAASLLTMTTSPAHMVIGLERLLQPLKITGISPQDVALMVSMALRFIPLLDGELEHIKTAQLARGANLNPRRLSAKIRAIGCLAAPLSMNVFRRCDGLIEAMEARGYRQGPRTHLYELVMTRTDYAVIGAFIIILVTAFIL
ncbi:MAG: energy-coupling factor transporter transmembrane component T [Syntrophomonadaceae bacterium]|nr:energy-coupling factor transporter transmembrane component T [Syntrophomonadaceae bacterium]